MTMHHDTHDLPRVAKVAVTRRTTIVSSDSPYRPTYSTTPNTSGSKGSYFPTVTATVTAGASASPTASVTAPPHSHSLPSITATSPSRPSRPSSPPPVSMISQFGSPLPKHRARTRPSTSSAASSASVIAAIRPRSSSAKGKTTYAPLQADSPFPQRTIRPSSSASLLLEKTANSGINSSSASNATNSNSTTDSATTNTNTTPASGLPRIPALPTGPTSKEEKRLGRIIPVAPGPVPPDERPDYGWNQPAGVIAHFNAKADTVAARGGDKSKSASWTQGFVEKGAKGSAIASAESEKKRWSSSTLARLKKWSKPLTMTHSKYTMQVEAYLKQQRDYEAQRIADENQPPIKLPDTAVAGTTIAGHRYIAISIPLEADPFSPCLSQNQSNGQPAQLLSSSSSQQRQQHHHQPQQTPQKPCKPSPHRGPLSQHPLSLSPPPSRPRVSSLSAITTQSTAAAAASGASTATVADTNAAQPAGSMQSHLPQPDTQVSTGRRNAIHTPSQSIGNESSVSRPATESGSDSGSNTYADSVTTANTSATSTPTISESGQRPGMVPRRSTSMLAQIKQQQAMSMSMAKDANKDITVTSTATSTTTTVQIPRRRNGTVSGGFARTTESIDQVILDGQSISLQSAYPRPVRPVPDIPPIAAQKAKLAQMQAARLVAERDEPERDVPSRNKTTGGSMHSASSSKTSLQLPSSRSRQHDNVAKATSNSAAPSVTSSSANSRRENKTLSSTESTRAKASTEWRKNRQERVRERKMRDIERARSVRSQGSRNSVESPLESGLAPSISSVMVIVDLTPHQVPSISKSAPALEDKAHGKELSRSKRRFKKMRKLSGSSDSDSDSERPDSRGSVAETVMSTASAPLARHSHNCASRRTVQSYDLHDMERRLRKLELSSGGNAVVKALEPALANLDRTLMTLYEGRVVEWMTEAAEKRRSRIVMETLESQSNPRTPESSVYGERTFRLSRGPE
ncbi:hypothetical protein Cpir12675_000283 [Ceratocystis pirilliformis]|uniref:Uncharacterized protein n=1 Tax=Ceratocystis pirilliformis TaxID=259994 RepID=A0ABR3ZQI2_9PEZI